MQTVSEEKKQDVLRQVRYWLDQNDNTIESVTVTITVSDNDDWDV
jgi:hypothetical protein